MLGIYCILHLYLCAVCKSSCVCLIISECHGTCIAHCVYSNPYTSPTHTPLHALQFQQAILELQQRVQSTRERTLAVLKEKEAELEQMRQDLLVFEKQKQGRLSSLQSLPILHRLPSVKSVGDAEDGDERREGGAVAGEGGGVEVSVCQCQRAFPHIFPDL